MKSSFIIRLVLVSLLISLLSSPAFSDVAIIVHPDNEITLDDKSIARIFLVKTKKFPNGNEAVPVDNQEIKAQFDKEILKKSKSQLDSYWAKQVFTGKATPPTIVPNTDKVKELVASDPKVIGYIDAASVDDTVKVIFRF